MSGHGRHDGDAKFYNPYAFVFAPSRDGYEAGSPLADAAPNGHGRAEADALSGVLTIEMTTQTPLLIPNAANATLANDHLTYSCRRDARGAPLIPPTSVKGMLRSWYEAVTNSRFGVFRSHDELLGYRSTARQGVHAVPVRVVEGNRVELLTGTFNPKKAPPQQRYEAASPQNPLSVLTEDGDGVKEPLMAAWVLRARIGNMSDGARPRHGMCVSATVELWQKSTPELDREGQPVVVNGVARKKPGFKYWRVISDPLLLDRSETKAMELRPPFKSGAGEFETNWFESNENGNHAPVRGADAKRMVVRGYYCETGYNAKKKHDERVFFRDQNFLPAHVRVLPYDSDVAKRWLRLIEDYQKLGEMWDPATAPAPEQSRHCLDESLVAEPRVGDLCYALLRFNDAGNLAVADLVPVTLSRRLYRRTPAELLDPTLKPATDVARLSPAERVFGLVLQGRKKSGSAAYRGHLRIGTVDWQDDKGSPSDAFEDCRYVDGAARPLPLAILSAPKPTQGRFYTAARDGTSKQGEPERALYGTSTDTLAGRKVYPHHGSTSRRGYWLASVSASAAREMPHREYARYGGAGDGQNRSIREWIKPQQKFRFRVAFENLSPFELGALLWLLRRRPNSQAHFRLGAGKPLGFGSVTLRLCDDASHLTSGAAVRTAYEGLPSLATPIWDGAYADELAHGFEAAMRDAGHGDLLGAVDAALEGFDDKHLVHYPRLRAKPAASVTDKGHIYEWFMANRDEKRGLLQALAPLTGNDGQPIGDLLLDQRPRRE